jgi:hypothetical protein
MNDERGSDEVKAFHSSFITAAFIVYIFEGNKP